MAVATWPLIPVQSTIMKNFDHLRIYLSSKVLGESSLRRSYIFTSLPPSDASMQVLNLMFSLALFRCLVHDSIPS